MKKRSRRAARSADPAAVGIHEKAAEPGYWAGFLAFLDRHALWLSVGLVLLATGRIVSTYTTFSHTFDEPAHLACGMEWLEKHTYTYEPQHPPLTRVMTAFLPRMFGSHGAGQTSMWDEGLAILFAHGPEDSTLALARLGTLPFFWITCWIVYSSTRWISGSSEGGSERSAAAAVIAVFLATMTPTLLAHAGLATTDMGLTAMLLLAIYTGWRWMEEPVLWRAAVFGASTGLAVLAKFSTLPFLPSIALVALVIWSCFERPAMGTLVKLVRARGVQLLLAVIVASLLIWAGYRFSFGKTLGVSFSVPAPELFSGIADVRKHNVSGHLTYMLGAANTVGWWYFYVVALAVKTPLAVLALGLSGLALLFSRKRFGTRGWMVPSVILGILLFASFFSQIKIGTRHVLPVFVMLAVAGGCAAIWIPRVLKQQGLAQTAVALLLLSIAISSVSAHPDYLAYFNMIVNGKPEAYLVDSDLDWGQDTKRLAQRLKEVGAKEVYFNQFAVGNLEKEYGFPPIRPLDVNGPQLGWNAISLTPLKLGFYGDTRYVYDRGTQFWPERLYLPERVGSSYILFNRER